MSHKTRANSAPPVLITAAHSGEAKFQPTSTSTGTGTTKLTPPQPTTITSHEVDMTVLQQQLSDTQDRLNHAISQLTAAQSTLKSLQFAPRLAPRPASEKDALIKRLTQELARKESKNQSLRHELAITEQKLEAASASHDEYRKLGTKTLRKLMRDKADLEDEVTELQSRKRKSRESLDRNLKKRRGMVLTGL